QQIAVVNVTERRSYDRADSVIVERIRGAFARRAPAEVWPSNENLCVAIGRMVEDEFRSLATFVVEAKVMKETALISWPANLSQKAAGQNHIGVDVRDVERSRDGDELVERLHRLVPARSLRTSVRLPETAAAAAMAGLMMCVSAPGPCRPSKLRF